MRKALKSMSLTGGLLLAALATAAPAGAEYGGLGPVGTKISSGTGQGQVNPAGEYHGHAFAVNAETGNFYIADELPPESGSKVGFARVQAFTAKGEFVAENKIKFSTRKEIRSEEELPDERVGGLAVDAATKRVYLLLDAERPEERPTIAKKLKELEAKSKKTKAEEEEEAKLEAEIEPRDAEDVAASEIYSFSTEVSGTKLKEQALLIGGGEEANEFKKASEAPKAPLLLPTGIAVDPTTHDLLISGQQDQSETQTAPYGNPKLRGAVQRVHTNAKIGPRYVDAANCLDEHEEPWKPIAGEPRCAEDEEEPPVSPVVTPTGRLFVEDEGELWEFPSSEHASEESWDGKEVTTTPKYLTALAPEAGFERHPEEPVLAPSAVEEEGGALSYVPSATKTGEGTFYMRALFPNAGENGVVLFKYSEAHGAEELGWTGGQQEASAQQRCVVRGRSQTPPLLAAARGEEVLMLSYETGHVLAFAPGGEACGHQPTVTPPSVEVASKAVSSLAVGQSATLSSRVIGARALDVKWRFRYKDPTTGITAEEPEEESGYGITFLPSIIHTFHHEGAYEVIETVENDNLAFPTAVAEVTKVEVTGNIAIAFAVPASPAAGSPVSLKAQITDKATSPHITAVWNFGDGSAPVAGESTGSPVTVETQHAYARPGSYTVTLEASDKGGSPTVKRSETVTVTKSKAEIEEEEAAKKSSGGGSGGGGSGGGGTTTTSSPPPPAPPVEGPHAGVLGFQAAKIAGTAVKVSANGALTVTVSCPAGDASCTGSVALRTLTAVSAGAHVSKAKKAILMLASGSFSIPGGRSKAVTLHLSSKARSLLAHSHTLRARATVAARDPANASATTQALVTLRLSASHH